MSLNHDLIRICLVSTDDELHQIKALQHANQQPQLTAEDIATQGFVTADYTIDFFRKMHSIHPSIITKDGDKVVGYVLVVTKELYGQHDLLTDLFDSINSLQYTSLHNGNRSYKDVNYVLVGQLCVAKEYRGLGLVPRMYEYFREVLKDEFEMALTDVAENNPRSLKAHLNNGFEVIDTKGYGDMQWYIILWDWIKLRRLAALTPLGTSSKRPKTRTASAGL